MLNVKLNNIEIKVKDKTNKSYDDFYHSTFFSIKFIEKRKCQSKHFHFIAHVCPNFNDITIFLLLFSFI